MPQIRALVVIAVFLLAGAIGGAVALATAPRERLPAGFATPAPTSTAALASTTPSAEPSAAASPTAAPSPTTAAEPSPRPELSPTAEPSSTAAAEPTPSPEPSPTASPEPSPTAEPTGESQSPGTIIEYTVQPGDILGAIAERYSTTVSAIVELNPGINPDSLTVGEVLRIPVGSATAP